MIKLDEKVKIRLITQFMKGKRVTQKLLNYFNGAAIFTSIVPALLVLPNNFYLNLNDSNSAIAALPKGATNFHMMLNNYHFILLNHTVPLQHEDLLHYLLACLFCLYSRYTALNFGILLVYYFYLLVLLLQLILL